MDDQRTDREGSGMSYGQLINIIFHCGNDRMIEREWPAVPRVGEIVVLDIGALVVSEVHWDDDPIGLPYINVHLEPRPTQKNN